MIAQGVGAVHPRGPQRLHAPARGATTCAVSPRDAHSAPFSRRCLLAGVAGALASAAWARPVWAVAGTAGARLLLVGDSMIAGGFGLYLAQGLRDDGLEVRRRGKPSTGLARPDFFDWPAEAARLVAAFQPHVCVTMFGGNDAQGLWMGRERGPGGRRVDRWIRWHEPGWAQEYARRVGQMYDALAAGGATVLWVGMPVMGRAKLHARMRRLNTIYRAEMALRRRAFFIDVWHTLAGPDGGYARRLALARPGRGPRKVTVRASDGVHLTVAGAHLLADDVRARIVARLDPEGASTPRPDAG